MFNHSYTRQFLYTNCIIEYSYKLEEFIIKICWIFLMILFWTPSPHTLYLKHIFSEISSRMKIIDLFSSEYILCTCELSKHSMLYTLFFQFIATGAFSIRIINAIIWSIQGAFCIMMYMYCIFYVEFNKVVFLESNLVSDFLSKKINNRRFNFFRIHKKISL